MVMVQKLNMKFYQLIKNQNNPEEVMNKYKSEITDNYLNNKFKKHIPDNWYGFDIGYPINTDWMIILEKVVDLCVANDPNFEIHQIKLKYGCIRFYCESKIIEDIGNITSLIMNKLYDKALIY
jgi:hypothetical protein